MSLSAIFTSHAPVIGTAKRRYDHKFKPTSPRNSPRMKSRSRRRFPKPKR
jgi:hypothetical protein